ncbi:MAG: DNA topoisomerase IV subunit A, partial [Alphaproteobacteria bacterium]
SGKKIMSVPVNAEASACIFVSGDTAAVVGENRKLVTFPLKDVPELSRGRGVRLQRYKDGGLNDATAFTWKQGLRDANNRTFTPSELKEYRGARAQAGRIVPRGFAKSGKLSGDQE